MRNKIHAFLTKPISIILVILISATLTYFTGGLGYFFGLFIALIILWAGRFKWLYFGIGKPNWSKSIVRALILAISIFILIDIFVQPFIEIYYGSIDLSSFDGLRGNFVNYVVFILFMWVVAGFGEEFLYRGFFMKQFAIILGNTNRTWFISALVISTLFGIAHLYQGISGVIAAGLAGFCLSLIFYKNRENLILAMLVHGFYDMIGITLIFLSKERIIVDLVQKYVIG